jgi:hypothetical protein
MATKGKQLRGTRRQQDFLSGIARDETTGDAELLESTAEFVELTLHARCLSRWTPTDREYVSPPD